MYIALMVIGLVLMLQTGALGSLNECLIPALGEMWGDSKTEVWASILMGHDAHAEGVEDRLAYAAFDAAEPARNAQWTHDLLVAVEATVPRIIGWTVGQILEGLEEPKPRLRWSVERTPATPRKQPAQPAQPAPEPAWLADWLSAPAAPATPRKRRRSRART